MDVTSINRTSQVNECEFVSDTDQQFNDITLKSQNIPVIRSTPNMLFCTEDTPYRYNNSLNMLSHTENTPNG